MFKFEYKIEFWQHICFKKEKPNNLFNIYLDYLVSPYCHQKTGESFHTLPTIAPQPKATEPTIKTLKTKQLSYFNAVKTNGMIITTIQHRKIRKISTKKICYEICYSKQ
ncbi:hypothetical protein DN752_18360 [Echinicola strongylocentroti]|uniref:Uncharacterized protein n=1 Tax=Echinicola strongylocentroti TaxID=1795355 RepID=A0A2Z4INP7_9BACT|nr:hypothetical protein DN752_18360 [Echinicola strongylocentroti]